MSKNFPKPLIFLLVLGVIFVGKSFSVVSSEYVRVWQAWMPLVLWLVGMIFGWIIFYGDRLVDIYFSHPDTELARYVKRYFSEKKYFSGWRLLQHNKKLLTRLTFRSVLFQIIWLFLAIFTITSTNSLFGIGFVFGVGTHLILDEWEDYFNNRDHLKKWLFWQVNRDFTDKDLKYYLVFLTLVSVLLLWFSI